MAKYKNSNHILFNVIQYIIVFGFKAYAVPYEHSFTPECLATPLSPQYGGGIVVNPELNEELKGWTTFGDAKIEHATAVNGNKYIVASNRNKSYHSMTQTFHLESEKLYTFSGWFQVSHGEADVAAIFKTETSYETCGWVTAKKACWSMLKCGLVVKESGPTQLYFETHKTQVDIWADSISLQSFSRQEWESHQKQQIEKVRKTTVKFQVVDKCGKPVNNSTVLVNQTRPGFPFGCAINANILNNQAYQNWFVPRFKYTVFENELKWYSTEIIRGREDYTTADAMMNFTRQNGLTTRGHNILWDADANALPRWVYGLSSGDTWSAVLKRVVSVTTRYKGELLHWDVVNENLHNSFLENRLGNPNVSTLFYQIQHWIDPKATPFLNEYNTIEYSADRASSPASYVQRINNMRAQGYIGPLGIGLEGHFSFLNLPAVRAALDILAQTGLPMWVTELDFAAGPNQASNFRQILNELFSTKALDGIVMWSAWSQRGCYVMCLTDNNFNNLATGDVVDSFIKEHFTLKTDDLPVSTDSNGIYEASLYHGEYHVQARHPNNEHFSNVERVSVVHREDGLQVHRLTIYDDIHE